MCGIQLPESRYILIEHSIEVCHFNKMVKYVLVPVQWTMEKSSDLMANFTNSFTM